MEGNAEKGDGRRGNRLRIAAWLGAGLILLLPLIAMQFSAEVNWNVTDFAFAGALLIGVGVTFELALRMTGDATYRAAAAIALAASLALVWLGAGVGIIGPDGDPTNLMYVGVLAVGLIGAVLARFRPAGMALALLATALAQVVVAAIALAAGWGTTTPNWPLDILGLTGLFAALWLASAYLFRKAAR